jgi:hypothetical protein
MSKVYNYMGEIMGSKRQPAVGAPAKFCKECKKRYSPRRSRCPHCGAVGFYPTGAGYGWTEREMQVSLAHAALINAVTGAIERGQAEPIVEHRSWKVEVIADASGEWCGNAMRYPTYRAADAAGYSLSLRWMLVREYRVVSSEDPVNASRDGGLL